MINEKKLKSDSYTLGIRDMALNRSIPERKAMQDDKEIRKLKLDKKPNLVLVPLRTTEEMRDKFYEFSTKLIQMVDEELEKEGHKKVDLRGRRNQGGSMTGNALCELLIDYMDDSLDVNEYPHIKDLRQIFNKAVIPYLKERRLSRDY